MSAKKQKNIYICQSCGHKEPKWLGKCPDCGNWNSFQETVSETRKIHERKSGVPVSLESIEAKQSAYMDSGIEEMNRVLGGGIMKGSTILVGGEPGIGKSTLMLQLASCMKTSGRILYISGEESPGQIRMRADRLKVEQKKIEIFCDTELGSIINTINKLKPVLVIVDSIQTIYTEELGNVPGTVTQIKHCAYELNSLVKVMGLSLFLIGHVTKEGAIAGPKLIEHLVDTVLYFDRANTEIRFLRSSKNRFGPTDEIGIFHMTEFGLKQVLNPASLFLEHRNGNPPSGVAVAPVYEGSRVLLVEIQSLVVPAKSGISRVFSDRIDSRRVSRISAVLEKHLKIPFSDMDIYVNVAGGIRIEEVGVDLCLAVSLYSAKTNMIVSSLTSVLGEVSLAGEIRSIPHIDKRIKACMEMGFKTIIGPRLSKQEVKNNNAAYKVVSTLQEAVKSVFAG